MYRLSMSEEIHKIYSSLADQDRADLAMILTDTLGDPQAHSEPFGVDDGVMRTVGRGLVTAAVLVGEPTRTLTVVAITCAR